jgi:hypothetical protein
MGLGSLDNVKLADARRQANELAVQRASGRDPIETRRRERADNLAQARAEAKKVTFAQAAQSYLEAHGPSWKHRYARAALSRQSGDRRGPTDTTRSNRWAACRRQA